jgi:uncharacterized protein (TIGR00730 family)
MKRICVYSGSNQGIKPEYKESAIQLGSILVENNIELVYGGSKVGLMGEIANQMLKNNGKVTGVMPRGLFPTEIVNDKLTNLIEVKDMHERKKQWRIYPMALLLCPVESELLKNFLRSLAGHNWVFIINQSAF